MRKNSAKIILFFPKKVPKNLYQISKHDFDNNIKEYEN